MRGISILRQAHCECKKETALRDKPAALVTGANYEIGLQIAMDLAAHGFTANIIEPSSRIKAENSVLTTVVGTDNVGS
jgi:hypothetical protein